MNNELIIQINEGKVAIQIKNPAPFPDILQILQTAILSSMQSVLTQSPNLTEEQHMKIKEDLYDMVNVSTSKLLEYFAPEIEMRPDLTVDALKKMEDQLLDESYNKLSAKEKAKLKTLKHKLKFNHIVPD